MFDLLHAGMGCFILFVICLCVMRIAGFRLQGVCYNGLVVDEFYGLWVVMWFCFELILL